MIKASVWVVIQSGSKILFLKRGPKANNPNLWNLPGGGIEKGEKPEKSAMREVWEECGLRVKNLQLFCVLPLNQKMCYYYKVKVKIPPVVPDLTNEKTKKDLSKKKPGTFVKINAESSEYKWMDASELKGLPLHVPTKKLFSVVTNKLVVANENNSLQSSLYNKVIGSLSVIVDDKASYRHYMLTDSEGKILASARYWLTNKLTDLNVKPEYRSMGLGRTLVAHCQGNHDNIKLYARAEKSENQKKLVSFYQSLGFAISGKPLQNGSLPMEWSNANI